MLNRIKVLREQRGLRLVDVAAQFNPPKDAGRISMWETGKAIPRGDNLIQLARILRCRVEDIF